MVQDSNCRQNEASPIEPSLNACRELGTFPWPNGSRAPTLMSMPESDFERPGATPHPVPTEWPYHVPTPAPPVDTAEGHHVVRDESDVDASAGSRRMSSGRVVGIAVLAVIVGALGGSTLTAVLLPSAEAPDPIAITLETFPRQFMGAERNDLELRDGGFGPTVERLDREFDDQMAAFRFAYGGNGATLGYGLKINLTIADGIISSKVPRTGEVDLSGMVRETRRLISLRSATTSCTFEPSPAFNPSTGLEELGDFSVKGLTECILVDTRRNLSLRVAHNPQFSGADSFGAAADFRDALEDLHNSLIREE